jgi:hypothetical protein
VLARVRARVYRRRALGAGVGVGVGDVIGLRVSSRRPGAAEAIALPRAGSKLGLSTLNCF